MRDVLFQIVTEGPCTVTAGAMAWTQEPARRAPSTISNFVGGPFKKSARAALQMRPNIGAKMMFVDAKSSD
jgi:hypothetical protein